MIYLDSPYSHSDKAVRNERYFAVMKRTAELINQGFFVYSPILHNHNMADKYNLSSNFEFWQAFDKHMIDLAEAVYVLKLDGWNTSIGVNYEINYASTKGILVVYFDV